VQNNYKKATTDVNVLGNSFIANFNSIILLFQSSILLNTLICPYVYMSPCYVTKMYYSLIPKPSQTDIFGHM